MSALEQLDWEILDATADDWEDLEQIYLTVAFEVVELSEADPASMRPHLRRRPKTIRLHEIADRVCALAREGLLEGRMEDSGAPVSSTNDTSFVWQAWFRMTPAGKETWLANESYAELPG